jgi:hypothetical protein
MPEQRGVNVVCRSDNDCSAPQQLGDFYDAIIFKPHAKHGKVTCHPGYQFSILMAL